MIRTVITASGSHIPERVIANDYFLSHDFRGSDRKALEKSNDEILRQFESITGIRERRYAADGQVTTDLAADAAQQALQSSGIDPESLDGIIVAHNFGDVRAGSTHSDLVPSLAARVKARLGIRNPYAAAWDLIFGCPGWLQGVIVADSMIRSGDAKRVMVIGADTLSRISDPHDRDSLIYADGAGAVIVEARDADSGILAKAVRSDALDHSNMLFMGSSNNPEAFLESLFLKMEGRKLYKYALNTVAGAMKEALARANVDVREVKKVLIHQANGKMDEAILAAFYELYGIDEPPADVMPMTISWLGNSSVATVPTLLDLIVKGQMPEHKIESGDIVLFASVGAGMHINAVVYRWP
ncbi:MAG TPA: 3-oxoacyl-[acyl-carrier-protein] synthase III C-terminal domain-containing protein [Thermoanaerobaculia bacterium]|jgi:3-oxoacyl-[acyl-carrier-protein] synthase-3|nr:3-oxoacyl-[acyl-carrier-protein] synthase III C-terminal domain-containing protein [Thermoanaerobaculia bacterium]